MKSISCVLAACVLFAGAAFSQEARAVGPGKGELSKSEVRIGPCLAEEMTVKYKLGSLLGEPTVNGTFAWQSSSGNCRLPSSTVIWLRLEGLGGYGFVRVSPALPQPGEGFGHNVTGSPEWNAAICGFQGPSPTKCYPAKDAKALWQAGKVTDFEISW